jgi:uncharacterized protein YbjT (DUF2867 family)
MRRPTSKQAARLRLLGAGAMVVTPRRSDWMPLLRNGWVERRDEGFTPRGGFLPPLVITPAGYRALADALERDGRPSS